MSPEQLYLSALFALVLAAFLAVVGACDLFMSKRELRRFGPRHPSARR